MCFFSHLLRLGRRSSSYGVNGSRHRHLIAAAPWAPAVVVADCLDVSLHASCASRAMRLPSQVVFMNQRQGSFFRLFELAEHFVSSLQNPYPEWRGYVSHPGEHRFGFPL